MPRKKKGEFAAPRESDKTSAPRKTEPKLKTVIVIVENMDGYPIIYNDVTIPINGIHIEKSKIIEKYHEVKKSLKVYFAFVAPRDFEQLTMSGLRVGML